MENSFLYFGYGSGLNPDLVAFRVNQPVELLGKGTLKDYALRFSRKNPDGTARGNLEPRPADFTLGLLYQIHTEKFEQLAQTEPEYTLEEFDVWMDEECVKAFAFICSHCEKDIYPDAKYVQHIIDDAVHLQFPESYIEKIKQEGKLK